MPKRVFVISPVQVYPEIGANRQDIAGQIELLKDLGFEVSLFYFQTPRQEATDIAAYEKKFDIEIYELQRGEPVERNKYTGWYQVKNHCPEEAINFINAKIEEMKPDVLLFQYARLAFLASKIMKNNSKIIFRAHNYELAHHYDKELLNAKLSGEKYLRFLKRNVPEFKSIYHNEKLMFRTADRVLSISYSDTRKMKRRYSAKNIRYLPPHLKDFNLKHELRDKEALDVLYMGSDMGNNINKEGARYLTEYIIPLVNNHLEGLFNFHITGKNAVENVGKKDFGNLTIHGYIDDYYDFLKEMDICCIPVKYGRGCKIKMFEALKAGMPTIGFPQTFDGIPPFRDCFLTADNPVDFMIALQNFLIKEMRAAYSENAYKALDELSSKEKLLKLFKEELS